MHAREAGKYLSYLKCDDIVLPSVFLCLAHGEDGWQSELLVKQIVIVIHKSIIVKHMRKDDRDDEYKYQLTAFRIDFKIKLNKQNGL